jgi:hypothetical protein
MFSKVSFRLLSRKMSLQRKNLLPTSRELKGACIKATIFFTISDFLLGRSVSLPEKISSVSQFFILGFFKECCVLFPLPFTDSSRNRLQFGSSGFEYT